MLSTIENDILFDDVNVIENTIGKAYLKASAENLSPDCNCSGYTSIDDEEFDTAKIA